MKGLFMRWKARLAKVSIGLGVAGLVLGFLGGIGALAYFAEAFPDWMGFGLVPEYGAQREVTGYAPAKTLWDWLNLLLVPLVLTGGGIWFTRSENRQAREIEQSRLVENRKIEEERLKEARELEAQRIEEARELERERAQDSIVKDYLDQMTELLLTRGFRTSLAGDEVRSVARARTLTALRGVDGERKTTIVQFLYEAQLVGYVGSGGETFDAVVQLREADLSGFKPEWANLIRIKLELVNLRGAILRGAILRGAILRGAILETADLKGANLRWADLSEADLRWADLEWADLSRAKGLTPDQLLQSISLHGTILPDYINPADLGDLWSPPKPQNTPEPQP